MSSPGLTYLLVANLYPEATSLTHSTNHCRFLVLWRVTAWCVTKAKVKKGSGDCQALWGCCLLALLRGFSHEGITDARSKGEKREGPRIRLIPNPREK